MIKSVYRILTLTIALWILPSCSSQAANFNQVGAEVSRLLQLGHYARLPFDQKLGERIFDDYIDDLDPSHLYFLQSDIDEFTKKYRGQVTQSLMDEQSMPMAREIFKRYQMRVKERIGKVNELLDKSQFTFESDAAILRDREGIPWPKDEAAANALWKRQLEAALLAETIRRQDIEKRAKEQGKKNPLRKEKPMREKIALRYKRILQGMEKVDDEDIANYFYSAVAQSYDPHTEYFSARELDQFRVSISNKLIGIGALLSAEDDGATKIRGIVNNGPADKAGELQLGDRIVGVDPNNDGNWIDIMFLPLDKVVEKIRGKDNSEVALKVEPADGAPGEVRILVIKREPVDMKDELATAEIFDYRVSNRDLKLGVIRIPQFYFDQDDRSRNVSVHVADLLQRLKKESIDGLILDIRGNGGGSLDEVRKMTGFFNGRSPVVQVKKTSDQIETIRSPWRKPIYQGPLVVLTDKGSASASEILAGALQDYNRAVIIGGANTFGKGTVQQPLPLEQVSRALVGQDRVGALKLTIQKYYRPSGSSVQIQGVEPDIHLPAMTDVLEVGEGHAKHALPHDFIRKASDFKPLSRKNLFMSTLVARSEARQKVSKDFEYVREDRDRIKKRLEENRISLNLQERLKENKANEARRQTRNKERRARFTQIEKKESKTFTVYRLSLDDLGVKDLPKVNHKEDDERHMRREKNELADLDDTPEWPSGVDLVKREGLAVLNDLVELIKAGKVAGILEKP